MYDLQSIAVGREQHGQNLASGKKASRGCPYLVKVSSDYMHVASQGLEVVIALLRAKVPSTENVLNLPRNQQLLELGREAVAAVRDVKISQHEHQLRGGRKEDAITHCFADRSHAVSCFFLLGAGLKNESPPTG